MELKWVFHLYKQSTSFSWRTAQKNPSIEATHIAYSPGNLQMIFVHATEDGKQFQKLFCTVVETEMIL